MRSGPIDTVASGAERPDAGRPDDRTERRNRSRGVDDNPIMSIRTTRAHPPPTSGPREPGSDAAPAPRRAFDARTARRRAAPPSTRATRVGPRPSTGPSVRRRRPPEEAVAALAAPVFRADLLGPGPAPGARGAAPRSATPGPGEATGPSGPSRALRVHVERPGALPAEIVIVRTRATWAFRVRGLGHRAPSDVRRLRAALGHRLAGRGFELAGLSFG